MVASGSYWRSGDSGDFTLNSDQEYLFPNLKHNWNNNEKSFYIDSNSLALFFQKTKIPLSNKEGDPCNISGKATVIISSYRAIKKPEIGSYNEASIAKVLSENEEKYIYWKRWPGAWKENPDCTETNPYQ